MSTFGGTPWGGVGGSSDAPVVVPMRVSDLIYAGFRIAGILREAQRGLNGSDKKDGLLVLNSMLDAWAAMRAMVYCTDRTEFPLIPNKGTYSVGPGGDFELAQRPPVIEQAGLVYSNVNPSPETPLRGLLNDDEWQAVSPKTMTASIPSILYYNATAPLGTIQLWAIPTVANKLALYSWVVVNQFPAADETVALPQSFQEAIEYNLAKRLAARYPDRQHISQIALQIAATALRRVKAINNAPMLMQTEAAARGVSSAGHYNIFSNRNR